MGRAGAISWERAGKAATIAELSPLGMGARLYCPIVERDVQDVERSWFLANCTLDTSDGECKQQRRKHGTARDRKGDNTMATRKLCPNIFADSSWLRDSMLDKHCYNARQLCEEGQLDEAFKALDVIDQQNIHIPTDIFYCLLQRCINKEDLEAGRYLHRVIMRQRSESDAFLGSHLIRMFASCGSLMEANHVFSKLKPNAFSWSAIISAHVKFGRNDQAIELYHQMLQSNLKPDGHIFATVLKACAGATALLQGRLIHESIINSVFKPDAVINNALIDMYTKCGSLEEARRVFDRLQNRSIVTWNAMIAGYAQHGYCQECLRLFHEMQVKRMEPNKYTFASVLKACSTAAALAEGKFIHSHIIESGCESDAFVGSTLIDMYAKCRSLQDARTVFDRLSIRSVVTWTAMIATCVQHKCCQEAFQLFEEMQQEGVEPNKVSFVSILKACSSTTVLDQVRLIHRKILDQDFDSDVFVGSALIDVYAKCGSLEDAQSVFERLPKRNVVTWSTIIAGYSRMHGQKALEVFQQMREKGIAPDTATFVSILKACSSLDALDQGKLIHIHVVETGFDWDAFVGSTLIDMYAKCGCNDDARMVFDKLPKRDAVVWSAMIAGYAQYGHCQEAIKLFNGMQEAGLEADVITFVSILKACSNIAALAQARLIHAHILKRCFESNVYVGNTLVDIYTNCGTMEDASKVFEGLQKRDIVTWSAMIAGYAQENNYTLALRYFENMQQEGWKPDDVTFLSLISACSQGGLVTEGCHLFESMREQNIAPTLDHYNCMVGLLGRAGHLLEAEDLLQSTPFEFDIVGWTSLLNHCQKYPDVEIGRHCFNRIVALDRRKAAGYVLMSNIYARAGMQEDADTVEKLRLFANAWKKPGQAFIEVGGKLHDFIVRDKRHPQSHEIYAKLQELTIQMEEEGFAQHLNLGLHSMADLYPSRFIRGPSIHIYVHDREFFSKF